MANWRRFDPYMKDRELEVIRKAREEQERKKNFIGTHDRASVDPIIKAKIQRQRIITMRNKRVKVTLPPIIAVLLFAALYPQPAEACHRFSRWYYPEPQRCKGGVKHDLVYRVYTDPPTPAPPPAPVERKVDIPLPDMDAQWGGAMDTELDLQMQRQKALRALEK